MRPQVAPLSPSYSYRQAARTLAFAQFPLLSSSQFASACKKRGVDLGIGTRTLETLAELDRSGALRPVLFKPDRHSDPGAEDDSHFPEEEGYVEWSALAPKPETGDGNSEARAHPFYSRWQLLYVWDATDLATIRVSLDALAEPGGLAPRGAVADWLQRQQAFRSSLDDRWRGSILFLTRLQARFAPHIKGRMGHSSSSMDYDPTKREWVDPWIAERTNFDAQAVLSQLGVTLDEVKQLHRQLAMRALNEDPLERWHPLSRMAPFKERERLKDAALRAQDGYDAADMIKLFYYQLDADLLPDADEYVDGSGGLWRRRLYGDSWPTLRFGHHHLLAQLRHRGLWPLQVHLALEGDSDEAACREIFGSLLGDTNLEEVGITITNIRGVGNLQRQRAVFSLAKTAARWTLLICDREGDAVKDVEQLRVAGLLDEDTTLVWDRSFEEDNFTDDELLETARQICRKAGLELELDADEVRAEYQAYRGRVTKNPRGFASFLLNQCRDLEGRGVLITKPQFGRALGQQMLDDLEKLGQEEACARRRFLERMLSVLHAT